LFILKKLTFFGAKFKKHDILFLVIYMEAELKKWLEYLQKIEPPARDKSLLTEFQKKDIEFTKMMIERLRRKINERNEKK